MNLLLSILIFVGLSLSGVQEANAPLTGVAAVTAGQPADLGGLKPGDRIVSVAGTPVNDSDQLRSLSKANADKPTVFVVDRNGQTVNLTITPSSTAPVPLGIALDYWVSPAVVQEVRSGGAADKAGLKPGDQIVSVNGKKVNNVTSASHELVGKDGTATVVVMRDNKEVGPLTVDVSNAQRLPGLAFHFPQKTTYYNPPEALGRALNNTWGVISALPRGIRDALSGQAQGPGVTGPLGIAQLYAEVAQRLGVAGILNLTALLGISLFMINMLPLPALDGGRLLFILIEILRGGRRIAPEKEGLAHMAGMVLLLTFILIVSFFDAQRLLQNVPLLP
jgi:regulator of sigma E protease